MSRKISRNKKLSAPILQRNQELSFKRGDEARVKLMNLVKEGKLSVDNAMQKAYGMGVASTPYEELEDTNLKTPGDIYNFGVYWHAASSKTTKCILNIDTGEKTVSLLHRGQQLKSYDFSLLSNIDNTDDTTRLFISFIDKSTLEIDPSSFEDKNRISRIFLLILEQQQTGTQLDLRSESFTAHRKNVIKEGILEKKGRSAAFLVWSKRYVKIFPGEIIYFKVGEESNEELALSILTLVPGSTFMKKIESNAFVLNAHRKEYVFRLITTSKEFDYEKERDDWMMAIQSAWKPESLTNQNIKSSPPSAIDQEMYLKSVVTSLNEELEQLSVVLNVIDAPIRASTQVKKVREIVHSLNDQIHTGLLSWTLRTAVHQEDIPTSPRNVNTFDSYPSQGFDFPPEYSRNETIDEPFHDYYRISKAEAEAENGVDNYSHLSAGTSSYHHSQHIGTQNSYNMLNLNQVVSKLDEAETYPEYKTEGKYIDRYSEYAPATGIDYNQLNQEVKEHGNGMEYGLVNKYLTNRDRENVYVNTTFKHFDPQHIKPDLPPRIDEHLHHNDTNKNEIKKEKVEVTRQDNNEAVKPLADTYEDVEYSFKSTTPIKQQSNKESQSPVTEAVPHPSTSNPAVPAPPPLPFNLKPLLPERKFLTSNRKLKPLFWSKVPESQIHHSIWKDAQDKIEQFDLEKLELLFHSGQQQNLSQSVENLDQIKEKKAVIKSLLNPKKAQNLGIFLNGFKLSAHDIESKLSLTESGGLSSEEIIALKRFQPSTEEIELFKSIKSDQINIDIDVFMHKLCMIENLNERLDILLTVQEVPELYQSIHTPLMNIKQMITTLIENKSIFHLFEYVLSIGNYLNSGTNRGEAFGFKLNSLIKLIDIQSLNKEKSLLNFLVEELYTKDQETVMCYKSLSIAMLPNDISIKGLCAEVEIMKKDLERLQKFGMAIENNVDLDFTEKVNEFIAEYSSKTIQLGEYCKSIKEMSTKLLREYGESNSTDFDQWFKSICNFMDQVGRCVIKIEEKEKRLSKQPGNVKSAEATNVKDTKTDDKNKNMEVPKLPVKQKGVNTVVTSTQRSHSKTLPLLQSADTKLPMLLQRKGDSLPFKNNLKVSTAHQLSVHHPVTNLSSFDIDEDDVTLPTRSGYLLKLSGGKKRNPKWDRRFFELTTAGYLHYSKRVAGKLSGAIYLRGVPVTLKEDETTVLVIFYKNRDWQIKCDNDLEALDWYNDLKFYAEF